ncbi:MAG: HAD family hydrolase [Patescibacteria group bacterium]
MLGGITTIIFDLGGTLKDEGIWEWHADYLEVKRLARKYKIVIAANQPKMARKFIEHSKISSDISAIYLSWEINLHKPSKKFFQYVLNDLDLKPTEVVYVGNDLINDIRTPKKLGIRTIFITRPLKLIWIKNFVANLLFIHPDYVVKSIEEIK